MKIRSAFAKESNLHLSTILLHVMSRSRTCRLGLGVRIKEHDDRYGAKTCTYVSLSYHPLDRSSKGNDVDSSGKVWPRTG